MSRKWAIMAMLAGLCLAEDETQGWGGILKNLVEDHVPDGVLEQVDTKLPGKMVDIVKEKLPDDFVGLIKDNLPEELSSLIQEMDPEEVSKVSQKEQGFYEPDDMAQARKYMVSQCMLCVPEIKIKLKKEPTKRELNRLMDQLLISACQGYKYGYRADTKGCFLIYVQPIYRSCYKILMHWRNPGSVKLTAEQQEAMRAAEKIISELKIAGMSGYRQKAKAIHDWLVQNCEYDIESYNRKKTVYKDRKSYSQFDGMYMILDRRGVCESYAQANWLLLQMSGVPCCVVHGRAVRSSEGHAWNLVYMGDSWAHVDVTFDDPLPDVPGRVVETYFSKMDKEMSKSHIWNKRQVSSEKKLYVYQRLSDFVALALKKQKKMTQEYDVVIRNKQEFDDFEAKLKQAMQKEGLKGSFICEMTPFYCDGYTVKVSKREEKPKA